jgi:hypothetical protein
MLAVFRTQAAQMLANAPGVRVTPALPEAALAEAAVNLLCGPNTGTGILYANSTDALMYRAAATLGDVDVVSNAVTITGQHGIGIATVDSPRLGESARAAGDNLTELIFNPVTYQFIGEDDFPLHGYFAASGGLLGPASTARCRAHSPGSPSCGLRSWTGSASSRPPDSAPVTGPDSG